MKGPTSRQQRTRTHAQGGPKVSPSSIFHVQGGTHKRWSAPKTIFHVQGGTHKRWSAPKRAPQDGVTHAYEKGPLRRAPQDGVTHAYEKGPTRRAARSSQPREGKCHMQEGTHLNICHVQEGTHLRQCSAPIKNETGRLRGLSRSLPAGMRHTQRTHAEKPHA